MRERKTFVAGDRWTTARTDKPIVDADVTAARPQDFGDTVTLYHGTSSLNIPTIKKRGLAPLDVTAAVDSVLAAYGLKRADVPADVLKMAGHRRGTEPFND